MNMTKQFKYFKVIRHRVSPQSNYFCVEYHRGYSLENVEKNIEREDKNNLYGSCAFLKGKEISKAQYDRERKTGEITSRVMPKL